ncbi:MAG: hypothetical protein U1F61_13440 [Opitutaceae bacterium]|jgi:hypothetical protein
MMIQEAQWFAEQLARLNPNVIFPMCNIGSSTGAFRKVEQPWIDGLIFAPLVQEGRIVRHLDIKQAEGVDIVGDFEDPVFLDRLRGMEFKSVFCSNLLEHVTQRHEICRTMLSIVPSGGWLFLSVPCQYPYHPDPVDTGFRPTPQELAALFPGTNVVASDIVGGETLLQRRRGSPATLAFTLLRVFFPFYKPVSWWRNRGYIPWLFRPLQASCVVLQKN